MSTFQEGQAVTYRRTQRGGYGFVTLVPAKIIKVGAKRVRVAFQTKTGGTVNRWVDPASGWLSRSAFCARSASEGVS